MSSLDNAKLKELMKIEPESMSKEEYESFVSEFKNAQLLLPVEIYSKTQSDEINEPLSFKPVTIEENGCKCIPLFTDNEELKKDNPPVSVIAIFTLKSVMSVALIIYLISIAYLKRRKDVPPKSSEIITERSVPLFNGIIYN